MVEQNVSLKKYNTFGIDVYAKAFAAFASPEELKELLSINASHLLILGGGSNVLLTKNFNGLVLKNEIDSIEFTKEDDEFVFIKAGGGTNWHQFVLYCIEHNYAGVENLSLIPGSVGASPMQNIGAYGVELKDVFYELEAMRIADQQVIKFTAQDCEFGYRESIFKKKYKNQFVILSVTFKLRKQPSYNISYGAIKNELEKMNVQQLSIRSISEAVINIRRSKLPDPEVIGNAGSFFKNPEIDLPEFEKLKDRFPGIIGYQMDDNKVKLAAGWLIEQAGWKGYRNGDAGCHKDQALVLVNYGQAKGNEIFELSGKIIESVNYQFHILLEREVNIY